MNRENAARTVPSFVQTLHDRDSDPNCTVPVVVRDSAFVCSHTISMACGLTYVWNKNVAYCISVLFDRNTDGLSPARRLRELIIISHDAAASSGSGSGVYENCGGL